MSCFKLPLISPLAGTTFPNLVRVLKGHRVAPRYYFKMFITVIVISIGSVFHCLDHLIMGRKIKNYSFKESPLFIIGHWRSGTTLLHNLLSKDPDTGIVSTYHAVFPDSDFIFMIRNPVIVYLSTKRFFTQLFPTISLEITD